jgi:hypothetical protein
MPYMAKLIICSSYHSVQWGALGTIIAQQQKTNYSSSALRCLFASISNHMAKRVNWAEAIKDEKAAKALMVGI